MSLLERLRRRAPSDTYAGAAGVQIDPYLVNKPIWPNWNAEWGATHGYGKVSLVYRCNNIVGHALGTAPIIVQDANGDTVANHPTAMLMQRPNRIMGSASFWSYVGTLVGTTGFAVVEKERDQTGRIIALWPLNSAWCTAITRRGQKTAWKFRPGGKGDGVVIDGEDVIVFTWADAPDGSPYGIGPLQVVRREVGISSSMMDFLQTFIASGGVPMYAATADTWPGQKLSQQQLDDLTEQMVDRHGGLTKSARLAVLSGVKDIKRIGLDMNELAWTELRDVPELAIIQAYGIPASVAQIRVGLEHSDSRANAEVDEGKLYRQTIIPLWARFDDRLTIDLLLEQDSRPGMALAFDTSDIAALQESRDTRATWMNQAVQGGWFSVHSWHREMGLEPPAGVDYYLRSLAQYAVPVTDPLGEQAITIAENEQQQRSLPPGEDILSLPSGPMQLDEHGAWIGDYLRDDVDIRDTYTVIARHSSSSRPYREQLARATSDKQMIQRVAAARKPSITAYFRQQAKRIIPTVVDNLSSIGPDEAYTVAAVDWDAEDERLQKVLGQLHNTAGKAAFQNAEAAHGLTIGISWSLANPEIKRINAKLGNKVVRITKNTRQQIAKVVTDGLADGLRPEQISSNLYGLYDEYYAGRSVAIARTESMFAYGEASHLAYSESGVVENCIILDNPDHDEDYGASDDETCASRDGLECPLSEAMDHIYADHPNGSACMSPVV